MKIPFKNWSNPCMTRMINDRKYVSNSVFKCANFWTILDYHVLKKKRIFHNISELYLKYKNPWEYRKAWGCRKCLFDWMKWVNLYFQVDSDGQTPWWRQHTLQEAASARVGPAFPVRSQKVSTSRAVWRSRLWNHLPPAPSPPYPQSSSLQAQTRGMSPGTCPQLIVADSVLWDDSNEGSLINWMVLVTWFLVTWMNYLSNLNVNARV